MYYGDTDSLMLKVKCDNLLNDLENGEHISSRMDFNKRDESIYLKLMKHQAPHKLLFLKSDTGSNLISNGLLVCLKIYCVQNQKGDEKKVRKGLPPN